MPNIYVWNWAVSKLVINLALFFFHNLLSEPSMLELFFLHTFKFFCSLVFFSNSFKFLYCMMLVDFHLNDSSIISLIGFCLHLDQQFLLGQLLLDCLCINQLFFFKFFCFNGIRSWATWRLSKGALVVVTFHLFAITFLSDLCYKLLMVQSFPFPVPLSLSRVNVFIRLDSPLQILFLQKLFVFYCLQLFTITSQSFVHSCVHMSPSWVLISDQFFF